MGWNLTGDLGPLTFYTSTRGRPVTFPKNPPLNPPSALQQSMRNWLANAARTWQGLTNEQRATWERVTKTLGLGVTGYNLWVWFSRTRDLPTIQTLERQSGENLPLKPPNT